MAPTTLGWLSLATVASVLSVSAVTQAEPEADSAASSAKAPAAPAPSASPLELSVGPRAVHRDLSYSDQVAALFPSKNYPKLAPYQLALGPAAFAALDFYPGAFSGRGVAAQLGVTASYQRAFATRLIFAQGTPYERKLDTRSSELFFGVKGRLPLGPHELALTAGYGQSSYELLGDEAHPLVPDVDYHYVRIDLSSKLALGAAFLGLHAGTRLIADSGAIGQSWFAGAKTTCFEGGALAGYQLTPNLDVSLGFDLVRYGFDFNPIPASTDPWTTPVAGGAVDQYLTGTLALRYRLSGSPKSNTAGSAPARSAQRD